MELDFDQIVEEINEDHRDSKVGFCDDRCRLDIPGFLRVLEVTRQNRIFLSQTTELLPIIVFLSKLIKNTLFQIKIYFPALNYQNERELHYFFQIEL